MSSERPPIPDFDAWVDTCFTRKDEGPLWSPDDACLDQAAELTPIELAEYLARLFENSGTLAARFSREQLAEGIWWVCGCVSGFLHEALDRSVPEADRRRWLRAIAALYSDLLDPQCERFSYGEIDSDPLCRAAYMLWDMDSLEGATRVSELRDDCLDVLQSALDCRSAACIVSGLHGLGHWIGWSDNQHATRLRELIDRFILRRRTDLSPDLIKYAASARSGLIL